MKRPSIVPSVQDVQIIESRGPWDTKSGGKLMVMFGMPFGTVRNKYFHYKSEELDRVPTDIRGLRAYTVYDLPQGKIGGAEWHRIREEMVFVLNGSLKWTCEDLYGGQKDFILDLNVGIWMPPFILHTYEVKETGSQLFVVANTLFIPEDPATHDTFSWEAFRKLKNKYAQ